MRLRLSEPTRVMLDEEVFKVVAEAENGNFCLLPRHADFLSALVPGLLSFTRPNGEEVFLAVDEGLLVKKGDIVFVSTRRAIEGGDLSHLRQRVHDEFELLDERQRAYQSATASLEANFLRGFLDLEERAP